MSRSSRVSFLVARAARLTRTAGRLAKLTAVLAALASARAQEVEHFLSVNEIGEREVPGAKFLKSEWIELFNRSPEEAVHLDLYSLSVDDVSGEQTIIKFPAGTIIQPLGHLLVCVRTRDPSTCLAVCGGACDAVTIQVSGSSVVDKDGGVVSLWWKPFCSSAEELQRIQTVRHPPLPTGVTFGAPADGDVSSFCIQDLPSPGAENSGCQPSDLRVSINEVSTGEDDASEEFKLECAFDLCPDWVELYCADCTSENPLDLEGYVLRRRSDDQQLFVFSASHLMVERHLVVICPRLELREPPNPGWLEDFPQTNFGLTKAGDSLTLEAPDGRADRVSVPELACGEVYARRSDGGEFVVTSEATPGAPNPAPGSSPPVACAIETIDRFPLRVRPREEITVFAEIRSGDQFIDEDSVRLIWETEASTLVNSTPMSRSKRVTCSRGQEEGIFAATIEGQPDSTVVSYRVEAEDSARNPLQSETRHVLVQEETFAHPLRINEVAASGTLRPDPDDTGGEMPGEWVELYNSGTEPVSINGLVLTNDVLILDGRVLGELATHAPIPPGGRFVVWCDNATDRYRFDEPHMPFRLNQCRDELILLEIVDAAREIGRVIDAVSFHEEKARGVLGRIPDGGETLGLMLPSPGEANYHNYCVDFLVSAAPRAVVINEMMVDNWSSRKDDGNEYGDWLELYNKSNEAVNLAGWTLTDQARAGEGVFWAFPEDAVIGPQEWLLVWCDNDACETELDSRDELHTNFELNRVDDFVELRDDQGLLVDRVRLTYQIRDVSAGRLPDGADTVALLVPTPPPLGRSTASTESSNGSRGVPAELPEPVSGCEFEPVFRRGDANRSRAVDLSDGVFVLNALFRGGLPLLCQDAADGDDNGRIQLTDAVFLFRALFAPNAPLPPEPGMFDCGVDPTPDALPPCEYVPCR